MGNPAAIRQQLEEQKPVSLLLLKNHDCPNHSKNPEDTSRNKQIPSLRASICCHSTSFADSCQSIPGMQKERPFSLSS